MAIDSVSSATIVGTLDKSSQTVLNTVFTDTTNGNIVNTPLVAGTLLTGTGSGGTIQGAIIGNNSGGPVITGITMSGSITNVTVPGSSKDVFAYETLPTTVAGSQAVSTIQNLATQSYGSTILSGTGSSGVTDNGVGLATKLLGTGNSAGVNMLYVSGGPTGNITVGHSSSNNIDIVSNTGSNPVIITSNAPTIAAVGGPVTVIAGSSDTFIFSDKSDQMLVGGGGNDTLVGGGGRDTLTGGAGNDVFIFNAVGHYTVTDFNAAADKLAFQLPGVTTAGSLTPWITSTANVNGAAVLNFGSTASITLVGMSVDQVMALLNNGTTFFAF